MMRIFKIIVIIIINYSFFASATIDIYTGPISTYLSGHWETSGATYAKLHGLNYHTIRPDSKSSEDVAPDDLILKAVNIWKNKLIISFKTHDIKVHDWYEVTKGNYRTNQVSLSFFNYIDNYKSQTNKNMDHLELALWLPIQSKSTFEGLGYRGENTLFGTIEGLISELNDLSIYNFGRAINYFIKY